MDKKMCQFHSGVEAKIEIFERSIPDLQKDIKDINAKLNRYGGALIALASIPTIIKILEWLTPLARAAVE